MSSSEWNFTAQRGFVSHDNDPESWDFRANTLPKLGLLDQQYSTDGSLDTKKVYTQWERFQNYIQQLNLQERPSKSYKVFYIIRHGEGVHNVKEQQVGREEWNRYWAKQPGDGVSTWEDAELVPKGEQQARDLAAFWTKSFESDKGPSPSIYILKSFATMPAHDYSGL